MDEAVAAVPPSGFVARLNGAILARPALTIAIIVSVIMLAGRIGDLAINNRFESDFSVYWRVANESVAEVYLPRIDRPFPYPPTTLLWTAPLALVSLWVGFAAWVSLSAALLILACRPYLSPRAIALVLISPPVVNSFVTGQVSVALGAALLWASGTSNRILAGAVLAAVASIKPHLVVLAPLLLIVTSDWKALLSSAATFCLIVVVSLLAFGMDGWSAWLASLDNFHNILVNKGVLHVAASPAAAAESWGLPPLPFWLVGTAIGIWLVIRCRNLPPLPQSAALACGSLMAAPYAMVYDLAMLSPFLVWSAFHGRVTSAVALASTLHPIPLGLTAFGLAKESAQQLTAPSRVG